jgi:hypothetical protein
MPAILKVLQCAATVKNGKLYGCRANVNAQPEDAAYTGIIILHSGTQFRFLPKCILQLFFRLEVALFVHRLAGGLRMAIHP